MASNASRSYDKFLSEKLKDPQFATKYLKTALKDEEKKVFLLAFLQVAKARGVVQNDAEDILEHLLNEKLIARIRKGYKAYLREEARPAEELIEELRADLEQGRKKKHRG